MAGAAVIGGIFSGILCFLLALVTGQGFAAAAGIYVIGGFLGASALVGIGLARASGSAEMRRSPLFARS